MGWEQGAMYAASLMQPKIQEVLGLGPDGQANMMPAPGGPRNDQTQQLLAILAAQMQQMQQPQGGMSNTPGDVLQWLNSLGLQQPQPNVTIGSPTVGPGPR